MNKLSLIIILCLAMQGCGKQSEKIVLVCDGVETITVVAPGIGSDSASKKVKKTVRIFQTIRETKGTLDKPYLMDLRKDSFEIPETSKKKVWIMNVDNGIEYFNENVIKVSNLGSERIEKIITVSADSFQLTVVEEHSHYSLHRNVIIDRNSGAWIDEASEYISKSIATNVSKGTCSRVEKQF